MSLSEGMMREQWTASDLPDQHGRVAVITGANMGIGLEVAKALASRGASIVLAVRDTDKGKKAAARISNLARDAKITILRLDLSSLDSIRSAADELQIKHPKIDLLINNAGVLYTPKQTTCDGFELQFGINHLGHFALTGLLLNAMLPVSGSRVVTVSSLGHRVRARINFEDLQWKRSYDRVAAYGQSKLANLMFTYELQRRLRASNVRPIAVAAHPGAARTNIMRNAPLSYRAIVLLMAPLGLVFAQSTAMGALPILRAATDLNVQGGEYYGPGGRWPRECKGNPKVVESSEQSHDADIQRRLWEISEHLTGIKFPV